MECPKCGATDLEAGATICSYCGSVVAVARPVAPAQVAPAVAASAPAMSQADVSGLKPYYQEVFREIDQNGGEMTFKWNWWPFLFGAFWYFSKGLWAKGLILFCIVLGSSGIAIPLTWIYCGLLGSYDYYLHKVRGKQLW